MISNTLFELEYCTDFPVSRYQGKLPKDKNFHIFVGCKIYSILQTSFFPKAIVSEQTICSIIFFPSKKRG